MSIPNVKRVGEDLAPAPYSKIKQTESGVVFEMATKQRITTPKQLLTHIGYDPLYWKVVRMDVNKWEVAAFKREKSGGGGRFVNTDLWQVKGSITPINEAREIKEIGDAIIEEIRSNSPIVKKKKYASKSKTIAEVDIFDFHLGRLVWGDEVGGKENNYDLKIAEERFLWAVGEMIERIKPYNPSRILLPIGNDFFNVNGSTYATFAGTPQHEDQRWKKTFKAGVKILRQSVDMLLEIAPVDIIVVEGNHDVESSFMAGEVLSAVYENNKNVTVDNSPTQRKYYRFGQCLIGFTHGKHEKHVELPMIMAAERPKEFGETKYREWHIGHYHHKKVYQFLSAQEFKGVTVRILRTLTETDAWHAQKGYIGNVKAAEAFIWEENSGVVCNLSVNM